MPTYHFPTAKVITGFMLALLLVAPLQSYAWVTTTQQYQPRTQEELIAYLFGVIAQLQAELEDQETGGRSYRTTTTRTVSTSRDRDRNHFYVDVTSLAPTSISRSQATLRGEADKGGSEYVEAWFEYGIGGNLTKRTSVQTITQSQRRAFAANIGELRSNTTYSFRAVVEDEDGNRQYGQIRSFTTVAGASTQSFSGRPVAETEGSKNIKSKSGEIQGFISMNDYDQGIAFFVYGTSRSQVGDAEEYDTYKEIPVADGTVAKKIANQKFTGRNTVKVTASGLKSATTYHYRVCVEYLDDRDDQAIRCGEVESFTTLN